MRQLTTKTINGCILGSDADNSMHYFNQIDWIEYGYWKLWNESVVDIVYSFICIESVITVLFHFNIDLSW